MAVTIVCDDCGLQMEGTVKPRRLRHPPQTGLRPESETGLEPYLPTVLAAIRETPTFPDDVHTTTGLPINIINAALTVLELKGSVQHDGGHYTRGQKP